VQLNICSHLCFIEKADEMKNILAIGASNSKKSINKIYATYIAQQIENANVTSANWDELILPLYSPDLEAESGIPQAAKNFKQLIEDTDAIVLSLAEYNGLPTAAFKNLWDWVSRLDQKIWLDKPMFLTATSPGGRGGMNALAVTKHLMPHFGGNVIEDFSFPSFHQNFQEGKVVNEELEKVLSTKIQNFQNAL